MLSQIVEVFLWYFFMARLFRRMLFVQCIHVCIINIIKFMNEL